MKIAVAGKSGVGKTTIAGTLSRLLARDGSKVLAIDADPARNLAYTLRVSPEVAARTAPISEVWSILEEEQRKELTFSSMSWNPAPAQLTYR